MRLVTTKGHGTLVAVFLMKHFTKGGNVDGVFSNALWSDFHFRLLFYLIVPLPPLAVSQKGQKAATAWLD